MSHNERKTLEAKYNDYSHMSQSELREALKARTTKAQRNSMGFDLNAKLPVLRQKLQETDRLPVYPKQQRKEREYDILRREFKGQLVKGKPIMEQLRKLKEKKEQRNRPIRLDNYQDVNKILGDANFDREIDFTSILNNLALGNIPYSLRVEFLNGSHKYYPISKDNIDALNKLFNRFADVTIDDSFGYESKLDNIIFSEVSSLQIEPFKNDFVDRTVPRGTGFEAKLRKREGETIERAKKNRMNPNSFQKLLSQSNERIETEMKDYKKRASRKYNSFFPHLLRDRFREEFQSICFDLQIYVANSLKYGYNQPCLFYTLLQSGIKIEVCNSIMNTVVGFRTKITTNLKDLQVVANETGRTIKLWSIMTRTELRTDDNKYVPPVRDEDETEDFVETAYNEKYETEYYILKNKEYYPEIKALIKDEEPLIICQFRDHYFVYKNTEYTTFYIKNYIAIQEHVEKLISSGKLSEEEKQELKTTKQYQYNKIVKGKFYVSKDKKDKKLTTIHLLKDMFENGYFKAYDNHHVKAIFPPHDLHRYTPTLCNIEGQQEPYRMISVGDEPPPALVFFADLESFVKHETELDPTLLKLNPNSKVKKNIPHTPCMLGYKKYLPHTEKMILEDGSISSELSDIDVNVVYRTKEDVKNEVTMSLKFSKELFNTIKDTFINAESIYGKEVVKGWGDKIIMYYHNLDYDSQLLEGVFPITSECSKGGTTYSRKIYVGSKEDNFRCATEWNKKPKGDELIPMTQRKGYVITLVDSYKMIKMPLKSFPESLNLNPNLSKGEAINYEYYNKSNLLPDNRCGVEEYKERLKTKEKDLLITILESDYKTDNIFKYDPETKTFNAFEYYKHYLEKDVLVLEAGLLSMRETIFKFCKEQPKVNKVRVNKETKEATEELVDFPMLDVFNILTSSSLANRIAYSTGSYNGLVAVNGSLRAYGQYAIRGGRVYANHKYLCRVIDCEIANFDAVSLYPSAMKRFCNEYGIPQGRLYQAPKEWTIEDYNHPSVSNYIVRINITKINKKTEPPCITIEDKNGLLKYINEIPKDMTQLELISVSKITLEDYIRYHDIEYEIVDGEYWKAENGVNKKLGEVVESLHQWRCKVKKTNKPLGDLIKLILNSIYGRTVIKMADSKVEYKKVKDTETFLLNNFDGIKSYVKILDEKGNHSQTRFEVSQCDKSSSINYVGGFILDMSKRIMNEVFSLMYQNNIDFIYTDTDSIHMFQKDVSKLEKLFMAEYGRNLIDDNTLGCFHEDFSLKVEKLDKQGNEILNKYGNTEMESCKNVVSLLNITLMPKMYLDVLQGWSDIQQRHIYEAHVVRKGITQGGLESYIENVEIPKLRLKRDSLENFRNILKKNNCKDVPEDIVNAEEIEGYINMFKYLAEGNTTKDRLYRYNKNGEVVNKHKNITGREIEIVMNPDGCNPAFDYIDGHYVENPQYKPNGRWSYEMEPKIYVPPCVITKNKFTRIIRVSKEAEDCCVRNRNSETDDVDIDFQQM